jgi:ABC-type branched-subunit amino acid transport system substrate-binding protein
MPRRWIVLAVLASLVTAGCGTRVTPKQAADELKADGQVTGVSAGAGGTSTGAAAASGDTAGGATDQPADAASGDTAAPTGGATAAGGTATADSSGGGGGGAAQAASTGGASDVGVTATEMRLGWVGTLTGPVPGIFRGALVGTEAFINYQNSKGGLMGRQLKLLPADDSLDSGKNRAAYLSLKDKVFSFVGSFSIVDDGGASVINDCGCPDVSGNLSKQMFNSPYHYGPQPQAPGWRSGPPVYYAKKFPPEVIQHWAFFIPAVAASADIAKDQQAVYDAAGFKVVYTRNVAPNDSNQTADVVQMQRAGVRSLSFQSDLASAAKLANAMRQQNFVVDLANWGNGLYDSNTFKVTTPDALKNTYVDQVYAMFLGEDGQRIPEVSLFLDWMKKTDPNQNVDLFALYGWLSARLFVDAMTKISDSGQPPTRKGLIDTLSTWGSWDGNGMVAPVDIGKKRPSDCFFIFTVTPDGKFQRTYPTDNTNYDCNVAPFKPRAGT